jgi:hypothetical protein
MARLRIRIMAQGLYRYAECEVCNAKFKSSLLREDAAEKEIREQFDAHRCKPLDDKDVQPRED